MRKKVSSFLYIIFGNFLFAFSVSVFILPQDFISSGVTGLALILEHFTKLNIEIGVAIINVLMLGIGAFFLGRRFFITTIASTLLFPFFLSLVNRMVFLQTLTSDRLLAAIFAGIFGGVGIGLVIRQGASTGGMDIPPLVVNRYTGISLSFLMYIFDIIVLCGQVFFASGEEILYGLVVVGLFAITLDRVLLIGKKETQVLIFSPKYLEINEMIQKNFDRGTTYLHTTTGYLNHDQKAVLSIISSRQLFRIDQMVRSIDSTAFMVVSEVHQVKGRGFDLDKHYLVNEER